MMDKLDIEEVKEVWIEKIEELRVNLKSLTEWLKPFGIKIYLENIAITANNKLVELKWELKRAGIGMIGDEPENESVIQYAFEIDMLLYVGKGEELLIDCEKRFRQIITEMREKNPILFKKRVYKECNL